MDTKKPGKITGFDLSNPVKKKHYSDLRRKYILRLSFTYLAPLLVLITFFIYQYISLRNEGYSLHLISIAESQSRILDIFLKERLSNLINLIDDPNTKIPPNSEQISKYLKKLTKDSEAFIDIGFIDNNGVQTEYAGPLSFLEKRNYSDESWYINLRQGESRYLITDIYLGLRNAPHFTIGLKHTSDSATYVLRASLDPQKIYEFMTSLEKSPDVYISIINKEGYYQLVHSHLGKPLEKSTIVPDYIENIGISKAKFNKTTVDYAYAWLAGADWAVITHSSDIESSTSFFATYLEIIIPSLIVLLILILIILHRSKIMVNLEYERDIVKTQLEQASKLATVGELSAGIAHEIGNPLNIIANEVGIMQDYANPKFKLNKTIQDLNPNFEKIMRAVFRVKDITRKLLTFVRQDEVQLKDYDINFLIDDFISGFYENEMSLKNIKIAKNYTENLPKVTLDSNQFRQVLVNLLNNASDAIKPPGTITISTYFESSKVKVAITDTGCGINESQINKIFTPFYTTKPVGKGTGLGLSVSYGIITGLGGDIEVESIPGKGSTFTVVLKPKQE